MNLGNQQKPIKNNYNRKTNEQNQLKSTKNQQTSAKHRKNREKFKATDIDRTNIPTLFMNQKRSDENQQNPTLTDKNLMIN